MQLANACAAATREVNLGVCLCVCVFVCLFVCVFVCLEGFEGFGTKGNQDDHYTFGGILTHTQADLFPLVWR